jgi:hypothetical protein
VGTRILNTSINLPVQKGIKNISGGFVMNLGRSTEVKKHLIMRPKYFSKRLFTADPHISPMEQLNLVRLFPCFISAEDSNLIYRSVTKLEIWDILKHFATDKSPGSEDWTVEFFTKFFDVVGDDLLELVEDTRIRGKIKNSLNNTFLALIPNENNPRTFGDYRYIALCNLCYKLISKVIANRIKSILSREMSSEQLGFLKGRQILDIIGTAQECLHSIKARKQKVLILKLDLRKAYDCVSWDFLCLILVQTGFSLHSINWIMSCVVSSSFVVLINGESSPFFNSERGLGQGCLLSPLLFIRVMESISILLKKGQVEGHFF